jgi:hypothetical protein
MPGIHDDRLELRMDYTSVAEFTANFDYGDDDNDEIIIVIYLFQTIQTASEASSFWEYSGRGLKVTIHLHLVPRLRTTGAILHSPLHTHVVQISFYCLYC